MWGNWSLDRLQAKEILLKANHDLSPAPDYKLASHTKYLSEEILSEACDLKSQMRIQQCHISLYVR